MFKIGDFSKLTNVTVRALHHYEELGILIPDEVDTFTSYRYYSAQQVEVVNKIKALQLIGLPLKVIKEVIQNDDMTLLEQHYELRESEIQTELEELKNKQTMIKMYKQKMKEGNNMEKYNVTLKEMPKRKVMSIREVISSYNDEGTLWMALYEELGKQNVKMSNPPLGMALYHDKDYKDKDVDVEVQSSIIGDYQDTDRVKFFEAPEFTMASITFHGSFDQMPEVSQALASWIEANNYKICGPMVNISHVSPAQDPNPNNWINEAGFQVKKANQ